MSEKDPEFLREEWALFGIGAAVILLRFAVRIKTVGFRGFQGDDFFSLLVLAFFTMDAATVHTIYYHGTNVEASQIQKTRVLTPAEVRQYEFGSKEQLAAWYSYTALIWCLKGTMLCFFNRLTMGLTWQHRYVKWLGLACVASYIVVFLTITVIGCYPTRRNWQVVPDPGASCTFKMKNFLITVILNVLTDAAILAIPVPLLWKLKIPARRKAVIALLLCSGLFVIAAAIIRVVLSLRSNPSALNINRWGVRETIVGIVAVNVPILKPLFNKSFWTTNSFQETPLSHTTGRSPTAPYELTASCRRAPAQKAKKPWDVEEGNDKVTMVDSKSDISFDARSSGGDGDSRELIVAGKETELVGVTVSTSYKVETVEAKEDASWDYAMGGGSTKASIHARAQEQG